MQHADPTLPAGLDARAREVLDFWFGAPESAEYGKPREAWFKKDAGFDRQLRDRFSRLHAAAAAGELDGWTATPRGSLALIVLLDQFSRNMFRDTPQAFAFDSRALGVAQNAVAAGFDQALLPVERMFLYLPFEHSEHPDHQDRCVELFERLQTFPEMAAPIDYARRHREVIARFGRFPHRNRILGRPSTPEEEDYLSRPGSGF
jgi:uncharacterized protein (DUF924 family)